MTGYRDIADELMKSSVRMLPQRVFLLPSSQTQPVTTALPQVLL